MTTTAPTTPSTDAARADWLRWRSERDEALTAPHDWLSVSALHWVTTGEDDALQLHEVPGRWWTADGVLHVRADATDRLRLLATDDALDGSTSLEVPEAGSERFATIGAGPLEDRALVEVVRRGGYYALRLRDPRAVTRRDFRGVPTFGYDPAWVLDVELHPYAQSRTVRVGAAAPGLTQHARAVGEVVLRHGGREHRLVATARGDEWLIAFSDATSGVLTSAWRAAVVEGDPSTGRGTVDLNRAVNYPYVFTDYGTCPRPVEGNHLDLEVTAGEKAPTGRTGVPPLAGGPTALPGEQLLP